METGSLRPKRSVRHAQAAAATPPPTLSARARERKERERRRQRFIFGGVLAVVLVAMLVPAYGYWREVIRLGDHTMATVDGTNVTGQSYARYLGTRQAILTQQLGLLSAALPTPAAVPTKASTTPVPGATPAAQPTPTKDQQLLQQLQSEQASLSSTAINQLVEAQLLLNEAKTRNITVNQSDLNDALRWTMSAPTSASAGGSGIDPVPTTLPATGIVSLADAQTALRKVVGNGRFLSADQVDELILKPAVIKAKLINQLAPDVPTTEDEVHARHILVATQAEADAIEQQLKSGADFATIAKEKSTDTGSKDQGGDLGWFGKGQMIPEFEQAAFSLAPGQISAPVKSQYGFHIIQVLAKDPKHPVDPARIDQLRQQPYQDWLNKAQSDPTKVTYAAANPSLETWVTNYVQSGNS